MNENIFLSLGCSNEKDIPKVEKLNSILQKALGEKSVTFNIYTHTATLGEVHKYLSIDYDEELIAKNRKRNAGRHKTNVFYKTQITPKEARERMKNGETAEDIANEIGISRAYFFRKLKEAEENNYTYIGCEWIDDEVFN